MKEVVSPVDGFILWALSGNPSRIGVFISPLNSHSVRSPVIGTIHDIKIIDGARFPAFLPCARHKNRRIEVVLQDSNTQTQLELAVVGGLMTHEIYPTINVGSSVTHYSEVAIIRYGSMVEVCGLFDTLEFSFGERIRQGKCLARISR